VWSLPKGGSKPVQLGNSEQFAAGKDSSAPSEITTDGSTAYWTVGRPVAGFKRNGGQQSVIVSRPLDGSKTLKVVAKDAKIPVALKVRLLYIADAPPSGTVQIRQIQAGKDTLVRSQKLSPGARLTAFTAGDGWTVTDVRLPSTAEEEENGIARSLMTLWHEGRTQPMIVNLHGDGVAELSLGDGTLAWGNGSGTGDAGMYLLELDSRHIFKVGELEGGSNATVCGSTISWAIQGKTPAFAHAIAHWTS
jgi:hypothetical protein